MVFVRGPEDSGMFEIDFAAENEKLCSLKRGLLELRKGTVLG